MGDPLDDPIGLEAALASGVPADLLVPCDVAGLLDAADVLRSHAAVLEGAGAALARVEVANWRGRAADGFTDVLTPEPARWRAAADSFVAGAVALEGFVDCIGPARSTAGDAIALWQQYLAAAESAVALAGAPAQPAGSGSVQFGARVVDQQRAAASGPSAAALASDADSLRRQSITTLAAARRQVQSAGDVTTEALSRAAELAPQARRFWEGTIRPADIVGIGHSSLDAVGLVPALGIIPDGVNAAWYGISGDGVNAAISTAAMIPFADPVLLARIARNLTIRPVKLTNALANPAPDVLFIAGSDTHVNLTPRTHDAKGLSSYDNLDAHIFLNGGKVQIVEVNQLKDLGVHGPDAPDGHYSIRPEAGEELLAWMATRDQDTPHALAQELMGSVNDWTRVPRRRP